MLPAPSEILTVEVSSERERNRSGQNDELVADEE